MDVPSVDDVHFARIASNGSLIGASQISTPPTPAGSCCSSLAWTGSEYGVAYRKYKNMYDIWFARIDLNGNRIGDEVEVIDESDNSGNPSLVWSGSEFGCAWNYGGASSYQIRFARIGAGGQRIGSVIDVKSANTNKEFYPSVVWTGSRYGIAWSDKYSSVYEIYLSTLDAAGNKVLNEKRITSSAAESTRPSLVWTGSEYGIAWIEDVQGKGEIYFARVQEDGVLSYQSRLTYNSENSGRPNLAWSGSHYNATWRDDRDGNDEVYFIIIPK